PAQAPYALPSPSRVDVNGSVIERLRGSGIVVEGSELTVERSVVRDIAADAWGVGRGIEALTDPIGGQPAKLTAQQTVVERAHDRGIGGDGAAAVIEDATVRDIGTDEAGTTPTKDESFIDADPCLGVAIRARWNLVRPAPDEADVVVRRSFVSGAREAAVTAEGARLDIERSL